MRPFASSPSFIRQLFLTDLQWISSVDHNIIRIVGILLLFQDKPFCSPLSIQRFVLQQIDQNSIKEVASSFEKKCNIPSKFSQELCICPFS
mmetsp:Transcript_2209/g.4194  ORF Transcript_2209/g.4194 Transcript_2209/m.4194 type:complete len:91 (-) Transcript_2209:8-280(-)